MALTIRQEAFVREYLIDLNATQACIRAGYSTKGASQQGSELLALPKIRACVDKAMALRSRRTGVNADRVVRELARIGFASLPDIVDMDTATMRPDATADDRAALLSVRVKMTPTPDGIGVEREIKMTDKIKALDLLGRHTGATIDREALKLARERLELERQKANQGTPDAKDTGVVLIPAVPDDPDTETT